MTYYSEHGQDRWLEENIFKGKLGGVFVELGALNGLYTSNTLFFERERDWNGVLIEANPYLFCQLLASERRAEKVYGAVAATSGIAPFTAVSGMVGWSGLGLYMDLRHRRRILDAGAGSTSFHVATVSLATILRRCEIKRVDYLSLDVEGAELSVLHGIDWAACDIDVLDIENNYGEPVVEEFLKTFGYRKIHTIEINDIYRRVP